MQPNTSIQHAKQRGFTLIEILLAVMIFAMLMLATFQLFDSVLKTNERSETQFVQQNQLNIGWSIILQDLLQMRSRTHRDIQGDLRSAYETTQEYHAIFTRGGLPPITGVTPGGMQLVAYEFDKEKNQINRLTWPALDLANDSEPFVQPLVANVKEFTIEHLTKDNDWSEVWPPTDSGASSTVVTAELPRMLRITIIFNDEREFLRLVPGPTSV